MAKNFTTTLVLLGTLAVMPASAKQLSPEEALDAALGSREPSVMSGRSVSPVQPKYKLAYTRHLDGDNACYVFNREGASGFMVVSADDVAPALLGYSDEGTFNPNDIPPAMQYWLDCYASQIRYAVENGQLAQIGTVTAADRADIAPLVTVHWNQMEPYNDLCPKNMPTGCVATAMAQVMKYYNWPDRGTGSYSYTWNNQKLSASFNTAYDWDNMIETYEESLGSFTYPVGTEAEKKAVATLMYHLGVAVEMQYASAGSGALSVDAAGALAKYFKYDKGIQYLAREFYTAKEWDDMIYAELKAGRPVLYGGQSSGGGHEFVCDGYRSGGYYHINWGWGGTSDGYFLLSNLNPYEQGVGGGSDDGFNSAQDIIIGIKPDRDGTSTAVPASMNWVGNFMTEKDTYFRTGNPTVYIGDVSDAESTAFVNYSWSTINLEELGVKLVGADGRVEYIGWQVDDGALKPGHGYLAYPISSDQFPMNGVYTVSPAFKSGGKWRDDVKVEVGRKDKLTLTATSTLLKFEDYKSGIETVEVGSEVSLSPNPADTYAEVKSNNPIESIEVYSMTGMMMSSMAVNGETSCTIDVAGLAAGHYIVKVVTDKGVMVKRLIKQ